VVEYCPRCGARGSVRFCYLCSDGEADEARAQELVDAWSAGNPLAKRLLEDITDPRAYDVVARAAADDRLDVQRSALIALGGIADPRGIPIATAALQDREDAVRAAAIGALAEMGPGGADPIAKRLADPRDRLEAARALAWLHDERAFEPLALILDSDTVVAESVFGGATISAMGRLGGPAAIEVLRKVADRVIAAADAGVPDWQVRMVGSTVAQTLIDMRDPATDSIQDALTARFGRLYVVPADSIAPHRAPTHPRRMVPRWSFELRAVDEPITEPVSKFGGQPVWVGQPTWPLGADGAPATFMAQLTIPGRDGLAYLFLDYGAMNLGDEPGILFAQPGLAPDQAIEQFTGPTFWSEIQGDRTRFVSRMLMRRVESLAVLEPGFDLDDWTILDDDPEATRDDERDWMKVGGNPRWLQSDEMPDEPGWRFLVQFTAARVGRELADGAEVYGLLHDDGRGRFIVQSH